MGILHGESTTEIDAPLHRVWALVADVERGPDWQGGMRSLVGVERDAEDRVLMADTQTGTRLRIVNSQVRFTYSPPTRLSWKQTRGDLKSVSGEWELEDLGGERTRAVYRLTVDPGHLGMLLRGPLLGLMRAQLVGARATELKAAVEAEHLTDDAATDRREIRELIENWALWRDARDWDRFRTVWHDDGRMMATWWQGPYEDFIRVSQDGWDRGVRILHFLGGSTIDVCHDRAIAQTKMTITQRLDVHGLLCDVVCTGRFYDFLARRDGRWGLVLRQPIYEIDRLTPVSPTPGPPLDPEILARFPEGYRHLAYVQTLVGYEVKEDMPGLDGPALDELYAHGAEWLQG